MSVTQLPPAKEVDYTERPATESARMRMLQRVPRDFAVEVDPNAPPIEGAQPENSGTPLGDTGRTYGIDQWLTKRGIELDDDRTQARHTDPRDRIDQSKVTYEKPVVTPVDDETDIDLSIGEKVFKIRTRDGRIVEVPMSETELRNLGMVQYRERSVSKLFGKINDLDPDDEQSEAEANRLNDKLYTAQRELLILMVPSFADYPEIVAILPLERYQRIIDTAQRYNALRLGSAVEGTPDEVRAYEEYRRRLAEARQQSGDSPNQ